MRQVDMTRLDLSAGAATAMRDWVAEEVPLKIIINDAYTFIIWCSPSQYKELAVGHLYAEDILHSIDELESITSDQTQNVCHVQFKADINIDERMENRRRGARIVPLLKASTAAYQKDHKLAVVNSDLTVKAQVILDAVAQMNQKATGFRETGGLHDSGIFTADGTMVAFSEDVGRHNTVDKVIGEALLKRLDCGGCFLVITGRVPGDMIFKAAKVGLPILASVAAVLNSGVASAEKANVCVVGFVRGKRMNVYTCPQRILL
ncbi:MAG: formate dehydrogenase accessory sulfurtransferase FdhD [Candidatus Bathyarchaeota archaeon]|nr:formate dehydrogenase accessory sulfurtransferase FdhD [Candidatus Bathyarchaeota archaeon]